MHRFRLLRMFCLLAGALAFSLFAVNFTQAKDYQPMPFVSKKATYEECVVRTQAVADQYYADHPDEVRDILPDDDDTEYLFKVYLRTPKFDENGCFEWKDPIAAFTKRMSLKDYVIRCMDPHWLHAVAQLFRELETKGFAPGGTCFFRGDERQRMTEGNAADVGYSAHGGSIRTGGCGHGRAVDYICIPPPGTAGKDRFKCTEAMWAAGDKIGERLGIYRLAGKESMHIQAAGELLKLVLSRSGRAVASDTSVSGGKKSARNRHGSKSKFAGKHGKKSKLASKSDRKEKLAKSGHGKKNKKLASNSSKRKKFAKR